MIRTQVYIQDEIHKTLLQLAQEKKTTFSNLIREGAAEVIKRHYGKISPQKRALRFFANPPKMHRVRFSKSASLLIREERD